MPGLMPGRHRADRDVAASDGSTMEARRGKFGDLERAVLEALWGATTHPWEGWVTVRQVHEALTKDRDIAYTTVMTVLDRMLRKSMVRRRRVPGERAYQYIAIASRAEMTADLMREALVEFGPGERRAALVAFVDEASPRDIESLRAALDRLEAPDPA